jgi:hypothetical protein
MSFISERRKKQSEQERRRIHGAIGKARKRQAGCWRLACTRQIAVLQLPPNATATAKKSLRETPATNHTKEIIMKAKLSSAVAITVCGASVLFHSLAWAGFKSAPEVTIFPNFGYATGSKVGARYSGDPKQAIGCSRISNPTGDSIYCVAQDKTGKVLGCVSSTPGMRDAVQAITDSSRITFNVDSVGICTFLTIDNGSELLK